MASLVKKKKGNKIYYYLVESRRVNGKPRIVWQKYLGTVESVVKRLMEKEGVKDPQEVDYRAFGEVCALLKLADELGVVDIINTHTDKLVQGISVGEYILLVAINRVSDPKSKNDIATWYRRTVLPRIMRIPASVLDSQNFWDHLCCLDREKIEAIELDLCRVVAERYHLQMDLLLYDTTNSYTFIDSDMESDLTRWADRKITGRVFCCVLALLLVNLLHRFVYQHGVEQSLAATLEDLQAIKEISFLYPGERKPRYKLPKLSPIQQQLFDVLGLQEFVP